MLWLKMEKDLKVICKNIYEELGGGYRENIYQNALVKDLTDKGYDVSMEVERPVMYKGVTIGKVRLDIVVKDFKNEYIIELKAIERVGKKEMKQIQRYMKTSEKAFGWIINFSLESYQIIPVKNEDDD